MPKILGIDISHWQVNINKHDTIDWVKAKSAGANFTYLKAGGCMGGNYADVTVFANAKGARSVGMPFGLYWFFDTDFDPEVQAQAFINLLRDVKGWSKRPMLDVEDQNSVSIYTARIRIKAFLDTVEKALGVRPGIYTRASWWNVEVGKVDWISDYVIWIAHYGAAQPDLLLGADYWNYWQFLADRNGRGAEFGVDSADIDLDWCDTDLLSEPSLWQRLAHQWLIKLTKGRPLP